jgi:hypothetical protein
LLLQHGTTGPRLGGAVRNAGRGAQGRHNFFLVPAIIHGWVCRGTVRVPMLARILRSYDAPEILVLAGGTLFVCVSIVYVIGTF